MFDLETGWLLHFIFLLSSPLTQEEKFYQLAAQEFTTFLIENLIIFKSEMKFSYEI